MRLNKCNHKFQPRYDEKWTTVIEELADKHHTMTQGHASAMVPYVKERIYIYDICIKCGQIVKRV